MNRFVLLMASLAITALLNGCSGGGSSADAPPDLKAIAGDSTVTLAWTADPDVEYWVFYGLGSGITPANWLERGGTAIPGAKSPFIVGGLLNGVTYSFTVNGRKNGGPGGPGAPSQDVIPRIAGGSWTVGTPLGTGRLTGVSVAATTHAVVGAGGAIYTVVGDAAGAAQTNPAAPADLNAIVNSGLSFVAVGAAGRIVSSTDAITWTARTSGTTADLYAAASTGSSLVAVFGAGGTILTSNDSATWTAAATSPTTKTLYAATFGNGRYVAVGADGTVVTSADAFTWQSVTVNTTRHLRAVAFGAVPLTLTTSTNTFVALGDAGTLLTSNDGLTWTLQPAMSANNIAGVTYGGQFVAVGNAGSIFTSADGITWKAQSSGTTNDLTAVARTASGFVAVGAAGTYLTAR